MVGKKFKKLMTQLKKGYIRIGEKNICFLLKMMGYIILLIVLTRNHSINLQKRSQ